MREEEISTPPDCCQLWRGRTACHANAVGENGDRETTEGQGHCSIMEGSYDWRLLGNFCALKNTFTSISALNLLLPPAAPPTDAEAWTAAGGGASPPAGNQVKSEPIFGTVVGWGHAFYFTLQSICKIILTRRHRSCHQKGGRLAEQDTKNIIHHCAGSTNILFIIASCQVTALVNETKRPQNR